MEGRLARVRAAALALFDGLGSSPKSLQCNQGDHREVPLTELENSARFLT